MTVIGAASGQFGLRSAIAARARRERLPHQEAGFKATTSKLPKVEDESSSIEPLWCVSGSRGKAFVDFQNDVAVPDVELAEREGFRSVEHLKRYTTLGMATDQGRTANVNGLAIMAELTGKSILKTGTTTARRPTHLSQSARLQVIIGARNSSRFVCRRPTFGPRIRVRFLLRPDFGCALNISPFQVKTMS